MRVKPAESGPRDDPDSLPYMRSSKAGRLGGHEWYLVPRQRLWRPPTDVYETGEHVVVKVEIAGMKENDFTISFTDRRLVIGGQRRDPAGKLIYQNMEISYGQFRTEVLVGWALDQAATEARYEDGFLYVLLPKQTQEYHVPISVVHGDE